MPLGLKRNIVELVDHDPKWKESASQTIQQLWQTLGTVAKDIQHVGSTSIRHIKAKPMIDIAVAIDDFNEIEAISHAMESHGFSNRGWFSDGRMIFSIGEDIAPDDRMTTHIIHIVKVGSKDWHDLADFRDYLNAHLPVAKAYEALKIKLASEYPYDKGRKKYTDGKHDFIVQTLQDAALWLRQS